MKIVTKEQQKRWNKTWYEKNKEKRRKYNDEQKERTKKFILEYKSSHPCKCGEDDPACLVFHHCNPKQKEETINVAARLGWSIGRLTKEIEKCEVMCANCHMKLHFGDRNSIGRVPAF